MVDEAEQKLRVADWAKDAVGSEENFLRKLGFRSRLDARNALGDYKTYFVNGNGIDAVGLKKSYGKTYYAFYVRDVYGLSPESAARMTRYVKKKHTSGDSAALQMIKNLGWI